MYEAFHHNARIKEVAPDILRIPFLTEEYVQYVILACEELGTWKPFDPDKYSTHDIHFEKDLPDLFTAIEDHLNNDIFPRVAQWWGVEDFEISDMFAVKYSSDTQTSLKLHHDDSFISASIKLNDNYKGAELVFPTRNFSNKEVDVGDLLVWPGQITHPHKCNELLEGTKYSLTIWTKQCTER